MTIPQIRRFTGDRFIAGLLRQIRNTTSFGHRNCPFCTRPMRQFFLAEPPIQVDACKECNSVWFEANKFEVLPENALESVNEMQMRAAEAIGMHRIEQMREQEYKNEAPEEGWKTVAAFCGFPIEKDTDTLESLPWATWILSGVIALISIAAFFDLQAAVNTFGFIPAHALRYGGFTMLTSFFLHGGIFHLLGNLYFLLIFGDNVEDKLGWKKYLLLILGATIAGDCVHWMVESRSFEPCVGASGGISAALVFYALQFPRAKLGFLFFFYWRLNWVYIPAWVALALWLLMQTFGVFMQLKGFSHVAATAHLGGSALGFLLWLWWRKSHPVGVV